MQYSICIFILFNNNNVIVTDNKGNIIVYSIESNKIISNNKNKASNYTSFDDSVLTTVSL